MPMKVTVCFEQVKVLVPCGDGEILVRDLIEKAITRYKKAQGKPNNYWVSVHTLRTSQESSILDPDDTLCDVVDDREQLVADFEEQGGPCVNLYGADGQSVSSSSPDIFPTAIPTAAHVVVTGNNKAIHHQRGYSYDSNHDVVVTQTDINIGSGLTVRRGSEPALNVLEDENDAAKPPVKKISKSQGSLINKSDDEDSPEGHKPVIKGQGPMGKERERMAPFSRFARDSWRQSLGNQPYMYKWLEAQERQEERIHTMERQGPVGGPTSPEHSHTPAPTAHVPVKKEVGILICLKNDGSSLGIHVVPHFNEAGKESGLLVHGIEKGSRIDQDGRLKVDDRIIEINGIVLHDISFPKAQEVFRNAMKSEEVRLKVVKHSVGMAKKQAPAVLPKPRGHSPVKPSPLTLPPQTLDLDLSHSSPDDTSTPQEKVAQSADTNSQSKSFSSMVDSNGPMKSPVQALFLGGKKAPPIPPARHPTTTLSSPTSPTGPESAVEFSDHHKPSGKNDSVQSATDGVKSESESKDGEAKNTPTQTPTGTLTKKREAIIAPTNTRKIGKRIDIELVKEREGLGFSVTTRDNATGGPSPIYIKTILPKGAAVKDGRLKAGDRLLEVNNEEMTGKTQTEAVAILRNMPLGSTVQIAVSRQEIEDDEDESTPQDERFRVPRPMHESNPSDLGSSHNLDPKGHHRSNSNPAVQNHLRKTSDLDLGKQGHQRSKSNLGIQNHSRQTSDLDLGSSKGSNKGHADEDFDLDPGVILQPADKTGDDGSLGVNRNKEILEFNIPLNDTGSAGLGVSVKGKILTTEEGTRDLGIFVKAVINGGAASKDGRLQVNDQLLEVNQVSLIQRTNTEAIELLRNAMQMDGPDSGCINIKVARRIGSNPGFMSPVNGEPSWVTMEKEVNNNDSLDSNGENNMFSDGRSSPLKKSSNYKDSQNAQVSNHTGETDDLKDFKTTGNRLLDKIMGGNGLRNESYTRATHESYAESPEPLGRRRNLVDLSKQRPRPHSTLGIERGSPSDSNSSDDGGKEPAWIHGPDWTRHASQTSDDSELFPSGTEFCRDGFGRQSMSEKRKGHSDPRSTEIYQKTRGHKEINKNDRNRPPVLRSKSFHHDHEETQLSIQHSGSYNKLTRAASVESLLSRSNSNVNTPRQVVHDKYNMLNIRGSAPASNLKRFSSLENLSTMPPDHDNDVSASFDDDDDDDENDEANRAPRMARRRGGNESFRAAVDRSYDPVPRLDMDTSQGTADGMSRQPQNRHVEEEGSESGSQGNVNSARSQAGGGKADGKKKAGKKEHKETRKSGGGLFNFFKFGGKGRKTPVDEVASGKSNSKTNSQSSLGKESHDAGVGGAKHDSSNQDQRNVSGSEGSAHRDHIEAEEQRWRQAEAEAQEEYRRLQQHQQGGSTGQSFSPFPYNKPPEPHDMGHSAPAEFHHADLHRDGAVPRAERIQQLRLDHQRRHQERQGRYPHEDQEEEYERKIQEEEKKPARLTSADHFFYQKYGQSAAPSQIDTRNPQGQVVQGQGQIDPRSQGQGHYDQMSQGQNQGQYDPRSQGHGQFDPRSQSQGQIDLRLQGQGQFDPRLQNQGHFDSRGQTPNQFDARGQGQAPSQYDPRLQGPMQGQRSRPSSRNQVERPSSRVGPGDYMQQGTSNYADYRDFPIPPGARHVSESNMSKYSNMYRPASRGASTSTEPGDYPSRSNQEFPPRNNVGSQYHSNNHPGPLRGQTPTYDRPSQHWGPSLSQDRGEQHMNYKNSNGNYQYLRGATPTNMNNLHRQNYADDSELRRGGNVNSNVSVARTNMTPRDHMTTRQEVLPPGGGVGGHYGNTAFREPVHSSALAGKRPVQQPNSARV